MPPWERRPVTGRGFSGLYLGFLAERADSVLAALRMIAYREGATLVHCVLSGTLGAHEVPGFRHSGCR